MKYHHCKHEMKVQPVTWDMWPHLISTTHMPKRCPHPLPHTRPNSTPSKPWNCYYWWPCQLFSPWSCTPSSTRPDTARKSSLRGTNLTITACRVSWGGRGRFCFAENTLLRWTTIISDRAACLSRQTCWYFQSYFNNKYKLRAPLFRCPVQNCHITVMSNSSNNSLDQESFIDYDAIVFELMDMINPENGRCELKISLLYLLLTFVLFSLKPLPTSRSAHQRYVMLSLMPPLSPESYFDTRLVLVSSIMWHTD